MRTQHLRRAALAALSSVSLGSAATAQSAPPPAAPDPAGVTHYTGALPDGALWAASVPPKWNGVLIAFAPGGAPLKTPKIVEAPPALRPLLLAQGYALLGSSYSADGWNPLRAADDKLAAITQGKAALATAKLGAPRQTLLLGMSYGGLVTAMATEHGAGVLDGTVPMCGLVIGGEDLANRQLAAEYVFDRLLEAGAPKLTGFTTAADLAPTIAKLDAAMHVSQQSPQGRARASLAFAFLRLPQWSGHGDKPTDPPAQLDMIGFMEGSRLDLETQAHGNPSRTSGIDFRTAFKQLPASQRQEVSTLYQQAGLDVRADLATLTKDAAISPDPTALAWVRQTSVPSGTLPIPVLAIQDVADPVAPPDFLRVYGARARQAHKADLLRTATVDSGGHCNFKPSEVQAALRIMQTRVASGKWPDLAAAFPGFHKLETQ
jgi:hypothetical protein